MKLDEIKILWEKQPNLEVKREDLDDGFFCYDLVNKDGGCIASFCEQNFQNVWDAKRYAEIYSKAKETILELIAELQKIKPS